jgi:hypothetical protein
VSSRERSLVTTCQNTRNIIHKARNNIHFLIFKLSCTCFSNNNNIATTQQKNHTISLLLIISPKNNIPVHKSINDELNLTEIKYVEVGR